MAKIILITGGAKSGKSNYALSLGKDISEKYFLATAVPIDEEMKDRINRHKIERGNLYKTLEEPYNLPETIIHLEKELISSNNCFIILDCITVWLGNLFHKYSVSPEKDNDIINDKIEIFINSLKRFKKNVKGSLIIISNEIGCGIVPGDEISRRFRDIAGILNQKLGEVSNEVVLCVSGIPVKIKE